MWNQIIPALFALVLGAAVCLLLFVPFVWSRHRRRGRLTLGNALTGAAAVVYGWAIWTYTLLPLPSRPLDHCAGVTLNPGAMFGEIRDAIARGGVWPLDGAVLQLVFNVALFVPLGFFIRVLWGRGVMMSMAVGFGISLLVELTQLTGIWGIYECAYRVFDVDDLILNTAGAAIGSALSLLAPLAWRLSEVSPSAERPRPVTRARRAIAMVCDILVFAIMSGGMLAGTQLLINLITGEMNVGSDLSIFVGITIPSAVMLVVTVTTGGSLGDHAVRLRYVGGRRSETTARVLRWAGGVAGVAVLWLLPTFGPLLSITAAITAVVLAFTTEDGRGLPGVLTGRYLVDARTDEPVDTADLAPTPERPRAGVM